MLADLFFRARSLFRRKAAEADLDDELRFHRERQLRKHLAAGLTESEALRRLRMEFGGLDQVKEECRDARGVRPVEILLQDVRHGLRLLRKSPGFTAAALLTLALGIGANTAIFSVLYGVLLRPLPYPDSARLIVLNETTPKVGGVSVSYPDFLDWREQGRAFSSMAAAHNVGFNLSGVDRPESISGQAVSANFLALLGVQPLLGRDFNVSEERAGTAAVVLLSYPLWQSHFGGNPNVVGRTLALDGRSFTVVGVLPPEFRWIEKTDVLEPMGVWLTNNPAYGERGERGDTLAIGRLAPGVTLAQARAEMAGVAARLERTYPATNDQFRAELRPIRDVLVSEIRPTVLVLFAAVTFVLLIACASVANLFLMRGSGRAREMALRMAIGATRGRIAAQMLIESLLLTSLGGVAGLALAVAAVRGIAGLLPANMLAGASIDLDGPAVLFAIALAALSALVFGIVPAMHATRGSAQAELKKGGRSASAGAGASRWRGVLVILEVSMALVLMVGAGLMAKSLYRLFSVDAGIQTEHVLAMEVNLRTAQYDQSPARLNFWNRVLGGLRSLPGVQAAALGTGVPLTNDHSRADITIEGMTLPGPGDFPHPDVHIVSPEYAGALGIPLLGGRTFTDMDNEHALPVGMISARLARQFFGAGDPVGRRFLFGHPSSKRAPRWITIVGVVGDTKLYGLANPSRLEVYVPFRQEAPGSMTLLVKSAIDPATLTSGIRAVIASVDKDQPLLSAATMTQLVRDSVSAQRITMIVLGTFGALALVLAAIGIYGVISYAVAQRSHEIGIRIALGAQTGDVLLMVMTQGGKMAGAGLLIGLGASFWLTRLMSSLLFSVSAADPGTLAAMTFLLGVIAMLACYIPARRAVRVDPVNALRCE
ncbi:MAG: ABC transporter permease [Acidobacteria bacterium]|nr:ABC transporter permease [Acidobacteriota bacterium]